MVVDTGATLVLRPGTRLRFQPPAEGQEYLAEEDLVTILSGFYDRVSLLSDSLRTRMEAYDLLQYHKVERLG